MNIDAYTIVEVSEPTVAVYQAIQNLLPQLSQSPKKISHRDLMDIIAAENSFLFVALDGKKDDQIIGMLCLHLNKQPTGVKSRIEDVVVDRDYRGKGIGRALMQKAIDYAHKKGADMIELTSHPHRETANSMYKNIGFEQITTNVYRMVLYSSD